VAFKAAPHATLPKPESPDSFSFNAYSCIFRAYDLQNTNRQIPVASGRISEPPNSRLLPVSTPVFSHVQVFGTFRSGSQFSLPPTPITPAGTIGFGTNMTPKFNHISLDKNA
jgi:hypothetical protein